MKGMLVEDLDLLNTIILNYENSNFKIREEYKTSIDRIYRQAYDIKSYLKLLK